MIAVEPSVVRFINRYSTMADDERTGAAIKSEADRMKEAVKNALKSNYYFALTYAIRLGEMTKDPKYTRTCVQEAFNIYSVTTEDLDIDELSPIFQEYLGIEL